MFRTARRLVLILAAAAASLTPATTQACGLFGWGSGYSAGYWSGYAPVTAYRPLFPRLAARPVYNTFYVPTTTYYAPAVAYRPVSSCATCPTATYYAPSACATCPTTTFYAPAACATCPTTTYYAPACSTCPTACAPTCSTCSTCPTTTYYAPTTTYYVSTCSATTCASCGGSPCTCPTTSAYAPAATTHNQALPSTSAPATASPSDYSTPRAATEDSRPTLAPQLPSTYQQNNSLQPIEDPNSRSTSYGGREDRSTSAPRGWSYRQAVAKGSEIEPRVIPASTSVQQNESAAPAVVKKGSQWRASSR